MIADETLREGQYVAGANRDGLHLRGVQAGRDFEPRFADLREARDGDRCPTCGGALQFQTAIEVGHIFKLGTDYSEPLEATFLDEDGREKPLVMGSYGIGLARTMAAIVEQHHDEQRNRVAEVGRAVRCARGRAARRRGAGGRGSRRARCGRRATSSSTTATSAPARSSPTPT